MKDKANLNHIHECQEQHVNIEKYKKSIFESNITEEEKNELIDFYIFNAPVLKNNKNPNGFNKSLKDYGWGTRQNNCQKLERALLKASSLQSFVFIKSWQIKNTLTNMDLNDSICISHERAVLKLNGKAEIEEDGLFRFVESENRMESLFRHIRNSLAHNRTFVFDNGFILLEDCDENENISARILVKIQTLIEWITILKSPKNSAKKNPI